MKYTKVMPLFLAGMMAVSPLTFGKENEFWKEKAFWKDMLWFALVLGIIYVVYVTIEYWPEITEGFNRGWNSR